MDWSTLITPVLFVSQPSKEQPDLEAFEELFSEEEPPPNASQAFIVRIWPETSGPGGQPAGLRGSIQTVGTNRRLYFYDLGAIRRFIEENLPLSAERPRNWWQTLLHKLNLHE